MMGTIVKTTTVEKLPKLSAIIIFMAESSEL